MDTIFVRRQQRHNAVAVDNQVTA